MQNLIPLNNPSPADKVISSNSQSKNNAENTSEANSFHQTFMQQMRKAPSAAENKSLKQNQPQNVNTNVEAAKKAALNKTNQNKAKEPGDEKDVSKESETKKLAPTAADGLNLDALVIDIGSKTDTNESSDTLTAKPELSSTSNNELVNALPDSLANAAPSAEAMLASLQNLNPKSLSNVTNVAETKALNSADAAVSLSTKDIKQTVVSELPKETSTSKPELALDAAKTTPDKASDSLNINDMPSKQAFNALVTTQLSKGKETGLESTDATTNPTITAQTQAPLLQALQNSKSIESIATPLGHEQWNQAVNQKVVWMASNQQQTATLTLNPPDLGPLQVVINVHHDQTDTTFLSDNKEVRQALQDGMDNLREAMKQAGINLGQTNINERQQSPESQQSNQKNGQNARSSDNNATSGTEKLATPKAISRMGNGLVDTFA